MSLSDPENLLQRAQQVSPDLADRLVAWQRQEGRHHLPWQRGATPTACGCPRSCCSRPRSRTVLAYFDRFLQRFPDVQALAAAPLDDVLDPVGGPGLLQPGA